MADSNNVFEAMVIPKGARIIAEEGAEIELNVQGDLILQESQKNLSALVSHHGSILIDKDVVVDAHNIRAKHVIRIMGHLETEEIKAESINIEAGKLECNQVETQELKCENGKLGTSTVKAKEVSIKGGHVEIGSIHADSLKLEQKVKGSILISSARERKIDDNVMIKGGFESDVELLGYLLKYRREIMSDRVLKELKARKEGQEFRRFFVDEDEELPSLEASKKEKKKDNAAIEVSSEVVEEEKPEIKAEKVAEEPEVVEEVVEPEVGDTPKPEEVKTTLKKMGDELEPLLPPQQTLTALMKLILASLRQGDTQTLKAIFDRWSGNLQDELKGLSEEANEQIQVIKGYLVSIN